jgi:hypothetical protein
MKVSVMTRSNHYKLKLNLVSQDHLSSLSLVVPNKETVVDFLKLPHGFRVGLISSAFFISLIHIEKMTIKIISLLFH